MQPPKGYILLKDAASKTSQSINVIGVITDYLLPAPSKGADWQCSFKIKDSSWDYSADSGFRVKFFRPQELLPKVEGLGSIAVCRNVKITVFQGMLSAISTRATECIIIPKSTIPSPSYGLAYQGRKQDLPHSAFPPRTKPTVDEQVFVIQLNDSCGKFIPSSTEALFAERNHQSHSEAKPFTHHSPSSVSAARRTAKFALIRDIEDSRFSDLVVEIIKVYPCTDGSIEIYVTDYTHNGLLFHYNSPEDDLEIDGTEGLYEYSGIRKKNKWPGPFGKMTLQIKVWPPHATWLQENVKEEEYVFLRNVRIKTSLDARLEGSLHADRYYSNRIDVQLLKLNDPEVMQILKRRQEYWKKFHIGSVNSKNNSMTKIERKSKRKRQKIDRDNFGNTEKLDVIASNSYINQHVKCANPHILLRTIEQIRNAEVRSFKPPNESLMSLPFVNMRFRLHVKVVDYWPHQIEDFSRSITDHIYNPMLASVSENSQSEAESDLSMSIQPSPSSTARSWEWAFYLLVEDAATKGTLSSIQPSKMPLLVAHDDAVHLLKLDAANLRKNTHLLAQLREKLFVLWGNLEDVIAGKEMSLSSRPFETCVREYGLRKADRWNVVHSMFGTTIM